LSVALGFCFSVQSREIVKAVKPAVRPAVMMDCKSGTKAVVKGASPSPCSDITSGGENPQLLKMAFVKASCWGCHPHGDNSLNGDHPLKGPGFQKNFPDDKTLAEFIRRGKQEKGMPAFPPERLSDKDLKLVIAYIRSLSSLNSQSH
jgi:mono/diheme cytochrome c family protein